MNIPWGSPEAAKFVTNVGLITSKGPHGHNIMAAEWTHHISYEPGLIAINIHTVDATHDNILKSKEFGVNLAANDQNVVSSIAGGSHGQAVDKIKVLEEMGVKFYKAHKIDALMVTDAIMNAECKLIDHKMLGDHMMFVGEVVNISISEKEPILYHGNKYYKVGESVQKPSQEIRDKIVELVEKHKK